MQRQKFFATGAGTAAALLLAAGTGNAPAAAAQTQLVSDADVWRVRGRLTGMIAQLGDLAGDYNGKRVAAIAALTDARNDLDAAAKGRGLGQPLSDAVMQAGLQETNEMIQRLSGDMGDYDGKRQDAIGKLNAARLDLEDALRHA